MEKCYNIQPNTEYIPVSWNTQSELNAKNILYIAKVLAIFSRDCAGI